MTVPEPSAPAATGARYRLEVLALFLLLVLLAFFASRYAWLERFDLAAYDALIGLRAPALDERLVIVAIDQDALQHGGRWPWSRQRQGELLQRIFEQRPAAVLVDIVYDRAQSPIQDAPLVEAFAAARPELPVALPVILEATAPFRPPLELLPFPELLTRTDVLGHVHVELDGDSISRGTYLYQGIGEPHWPHLALALADRVRGEVSARPAACAAPAQLTLGSQRCLYRMIPFAGPPGTVPALSAAALLTGPDGGLAATAPLRDKIVFVGLVAAGVADWVTSPVSGGGRPISGVEYNANLFNAVLKDQLIAPAAPLWSALLCVLIAALAAVVLPRLSPKGMLTITLLLAALPLVLSGAALLALQLYLPLSAALLAVLCAYPYWSWRRHEIAWRFVDQEMARVAAVREALPLRATPAATDWVSEATRLAALLQLETRVSAAPVEVEGLRLVPGARQIEVLLGSAGSVSLAPAAGSEPASFTDSELALTQGVFSELLDEELQLPALSGEGLAARLKLLRQQARRLERDRAVSAQALEEMSSAVAVLSPLAQVELANGRWLEMTGLGPGSEAVSLTTAVAAGASAGVPPVSTLEQLLPLPVGRTWQELWRQVALDRQAVGFESRLRGDVLLYVSCAPLNLAPAGSWAMTLSDVTEITEARNHREEALAFLSHDLRSPIVSVLALMQQPASTERDERVADYARRSLTISEQFLQLSRLESQPQIELYPLEILAVVDNARDQVFERARAAGVGIAEICWQEPSSETVFMLGNGELLERALVNLLGNAVKYSDRGTQVRVELKRQDDRLHIAIVDEGLGIPADDLPHLFAPYFRAAEGALAARRGAGLGLRFVRTVADRHGGTIRVDSEPGQGSTFTLTLPVNDELAYNED